MSINRIALNPYFLTGRRFHILFGQGLDDAYLDSSLQELDFTTAFCQFLIESGFENIYLYSAHQQVAPLIQKTERISDPVSSRISLDEDYPVEGTSMRWLADGPLQSRFILPQKKLPSQARQSSSGMGDSHAVRLLDTLMKDEHQKTAIIVLQAETTLRYHEDQRTLAALFGAWKDLPTQNLNACFLAFSANTSQALEDLAGRLPIPELRALIFSHTNLFKIASPAEDELERLLTLFRRNHPQHSILPEESKRIIPILAAEGLSLRQWISRFNGVDQITLPLIREYRWLSSSLDPSRPAGERLQELVGLNEIRSRLEEWAAWLEVTRQKKTFHKNPPLLHMVFVGNPGTGKTTVARLLGEILQEMGVLKRGHCVEVKASDLVAEHVGGTAIKTGQVIDQALDGILFIDEAYTLADASRGGFGQEAIDTLLPRLEDQRENLLVIAAGYPDKMTAFLDSNPGLSRRFPLENRFHFPDYSSQELAEILTRILADRELVLSNEINTETLLPILSAIEGNGGGVRNLADAIERRWSARIIRENLSIHAPITLNDFPESLVKSTSTDRGKEDIIFSEFDDLIGLDSIRAWMISEMNLVNFEIRRKGLFNSQISEGRHLIFSGNPGTGKTTVARLLGKMYRHLGLLRTGQVVEVSRADLVAGYAGQTAQKTMQKVREAFGGILFIDEAYALIHSPQDAFGQEALDTLVKAMEDHRQKFMVIVAGYPLEMHHFLNANPGLLSRFLKELRFPDFSISQLLQIFLKMAEKDQILVPNDLRPFIQQKMVHRKAVEGRHFGNARSVRKLYLDMKTNLVNRYADSSAIDMEISFTNEDLPGLDDPALTGDEDISTMNEQYLFPNYLPGGAPR
ncbi:MAG TPA: AAA family ATPase [Anaerolineaceae bacterium]|nr:AAA family ATPase [Anaerolineaceae bacterium]HPN51114.1 AAA family ATPase [Anaerolineaceae bacterium]